MSTIDAPHSPIDGNGDSRFELRSQWVCGLFVPCYDDCTRTLQPIRASTTERDSPCISNFLAPIVARISKSVRRMQVAECAARTVARR
jgi:hypothetical protein